MGKGPPTARQQTLREHGRLGGRPPSREASGGATAAQGGGTRREQEADSLIAGVEGCPLVFRVMMRQAQAQAQAQEAAEGEAPPERPRRMRSAPQRIREDDGVGDSDGDAEMEAGSDNSWDSGLRPSRKRERLHFSTDADTTSDDSDAMSSSDGAGSDGEPDWATDLMDSDVAMKFSVGAHARTALKYWFKGTVTAMRMRRGEALYTITFVDGTTEVNLQADAVYACINDYAVHHSREDGMFIATAEHAAAVMRAAESAGIVDTMHGRITSVPYWSRLQADLEDWKAICVCTFHPNHMLACAYCGATALGVPFSLDKKRNKTVHGGGVIMYAVPAGEGQPPAAIAYPWLAGLMFAYNLRAQAHATGGAGHGGDAAMDDQHDSDVEGALQEDLGAEAMAASDSEDAEVLSSADGGPSTAPLFWNQCAACRTVAQKSTAVERAVRQRYLVPFTKEYAVRLLNVWPVHLHYLSVLDVRPQVANSRIGVGTASFVSTSLVSGIVVAWHPERAVLTGNSIAPRLQWFLDELIARNHWVLREYACVLELPESNQASHGPALAVLPREAIEHILRRVRTRDLRTFLALGPEDEDDTEEAGANMSDLVTLDDVNVAGRTGPSQVHTKADVFTVGVAVKRPAPWAGVNVDDVPQTISTRFDGTGTLPLEIGMFPFLFPDGRGYYDGNGMSLCEYAKMRMLQAFTPFTMNKVYVLMLYQQRMAFRLLSTTKEYVIANELRNTTLRRRARGEEDDDGQEAYSNVLRYHTSETLPGTPAFFRKKLNDVRAMVTKFGMPSLFVTLTMDEVSDMRMKEVDYIVALQNVLLPEYANANWQDVPVEMARMFEARFTAWWRRFVMDANGPCVFGKVDNYVIRFEVQDRGSLHAHIMVWVAAADRQRVFNEIVAFKPPVKEGEDTMITTFRQHQTRKMMHDCGRRGQASFCRPEGHTDVCCKRGFPFNPHLEDAYEDVNARRWVYYRPPGGEHAWVASTIPAALLSWIGHANVQIATTDQLTDYMLKYEIKAEALGVLNLTCQTVEALGITGLTDHQRAFLSAALYTRPVCLSEAALHMLQIPVVQLSVTVDYYDTHPPRLGVRTMSRDGAPMYVPPVRIYEQRPPALEGLSFAEAMSQYERLQAATVRGRPPHVGSGGDYFWYPAREKYVVRFTNDNPAYKPETFFYNLLLRRVHFRNETLLRAPGQTYFEACKARGLVTTFDQLVDEIQRVWVLQGHPRADAAEVAERTLHAMGYNQQLELTDAGRALRAAGVHVDAGTGADGEDDADVALMQAVAAQRQARVAAELPPLMESLRQGGALDESLMPMDAEQRAVVERIVSRQPGLLMVDGCPGVGKTLVTKVAIHHLRAANVGMVLSASTARAALRLSVEATTTYKAFGIPVKGQLPPVCLHHDWAMRAKAANVIITDEYSMNKTAHTMLCLTRIMTAKNVSSLHELLRNCLVVLVGDIYQLPPICHCARREETRNQRIHRACQRCHIRYSSLWSVAEHMELRTVHRFVADPEWMRFLHIIREREPTDAEIDAVIGPLVCDSPEEAARWVSVGDVLVLCSHHTDRERWCTIAYNAAVAAGHAQPPVQVRVETSGPMVERMHDWVNKPGFHRLPMISVGARVMITRNLDDETGAVNGAVGTVVAMNTKPGTVHVRSFELRLDDTNAVVKVTRSEQDTQLSTSGLAPGRNYKKTFPAQLGYAFTGHASQGATISKKLLIDLQSGFEGGLAYVMFSRPPRRFAEDGTPLVRFVRRPCPRDCRPICFDDAPGAHVAGLAATFDAVMHPLAGDDEPHM